MNCHPQVDTIVCISRILYKRGPTSTLVWLFSLTYVYKSMCVHSVTSNENKQSSLLCIRVALCIINKSTLLSDNHWEKVSSGKVKFKLNNKFKFIFIGIFINKKFWVICLVHKLSQKHVYAWLLFSSSV